MTEQMHEQQASEPRAGGQSFFSDPAMDRFAAAFLRLLSEHWAQAEKLSSLIQLLEEKALIKVDDVERMGRESESEPGRDEAAADFVRRVLEPLREGKAG